jgi:hypothetical protein
MRVTASLLMLSAVLAMGSSAAAADARKLAKPPVALVGHGVNSHILFLRENPAEPGEWGSHPRIWLELSNRTDRALWVAVHLNAPIPDRVCDKRFPIAPGEKVRTLCTQDSIVAEADYTVDVIASADSGYTALLDSSSWTFQLGASDVREWQSTRRLGREAKADGRQPPALPPRPAARSRPVGHQALHLAFHDVGISFGNAPVVHGLRFNWRDEELRRVDGLNFVLLTTPNDDAVVHGIQFSLGPSDANSLEPSAGEIWGLGLSPTTMSVRRSRGLMVGGFCMNGEDVAGIHFGGVIMSGKPAVGIQVGALVWGGPMTGLNVAGVFGWSEYGPMTGINVGGLGVRSPRLSGLNVAGLAVGGDERLRGINVAGLAAVGNSIAGITAAGITRTDDLTGLSVGVGNWIGVQHGVTIGLFNQAQELHGIQFGLLNRARNNPGARRQWPILNFHFGR